MNPTDFSTTYTPPIGSSPFQGIPMGTPQPIVQGDNDNPLASMPVSDMFNRALAVTTDKAIQAAKKPHKHTFPWVTAGLETWSLGMFGGLLLKGAFPAGQKVGMILGGITGIAAAKVMSSLEHHHAEQNNIDHTKPQKWFSFSQIANVLVASTFGVLKRVVSYSRMESVQGSDSHLTQLDRLFNLLFCLDAWKPFLQKHNIQTEHLGILKSFTPEGFKALQQVAGVVFKTVFPSKDNATSALTEAFFAERNTNIATKLVGIHGAHNSSRGFAQGLYNLVKSGEAPGWFRKPIQYVIELSHGTPLTRHFEAENVLAGINSFSRLIKPVAGDIALYATFLLTVGTLFQWITGKKEKPQPVLQTVSFK